MNVADLYKKKSLVEHVLDSPSMYIGCTEIYVQSMWIFDNEKNKISFREVEFSPAFLKIFDEALMYMCNNRILESNGAIKICINKEDKSISVCECESGIPIIMHKKYKCWMPELIFGSAFNFNFENVGIKLVNIFSSKFVVEIVDEKNHKKYYQEYYNNSRKKTDPEITNIIDDVIGYTKITFYPDFKRFNMDELSDEIYGLIKKRAYDVSAHLGKDIDVYFNNELLKVKTFEDLIKSHYDEPQVLIYEEINDRWKVGVIIDKSKKCKQHVSFVNGIWTYHCGSHVDYISSQIVKQVYSKLSSEGKSILTPERITRHLTFFVSTIMDDPKFSSQTKEELTSKEESFGSACVISDKFVNKLRDAGM